MIASISDLVALIDDYSGCYAIPETVWCAMHGVTTSYWQNVQKLPYMVVSNLPTITYFATPITSYIM